MNKTNARLRKPFLFPQNLLLERAIEVFDQLKRTYAINLLTQIHIHTAEENIDTEFETEVARAVAFFHQNSSESKAVTINTHYGADGRSIYLNLKYDLESATYTGDFELRLQSKEANREAAAHLMRELQLTELPAKGSHDARFMQVNPLFHNRSFSPRQHVCFVIMPFREPWSDEVFAHVKTICHEMGIKAVRGDDMFRTSVLEDIWTIINEAEFIIADTTNKNANVFYEIGIAHTLGKEPILITQEIDGLPFDFRTYRHIDYTYPLGSSDSLRTRLRRYMRP